MKSNVKKDYIWNTIGVFLQNAISPLLLIVITRVSGIYDSGLFSFAFAVALVFGALGMWGGRTYQVSDAKNEFSPRSYIVVRITLAFVMVLCAFVFAYVNEYDAVKTGLIVALVSFKAIESIADSVYGVLQAHNKLYKAGKSLSYKAILGFALFTVLYISTENIVLASTGIVVANLILLLMYDLPRASKHEEIGLHLSSAHSYIRDALAIMRRTAPVFFVVFLAMFSLNIPRYFIDVYYPSEVGYFGIIAMPITVIGLFMLFIMQPNTMSLTKSNNSQQYDEFNKVVRNILYATMIVGLAVLGVVYLFGVQILGLIFSVDFTGYRQSLFFVTLGGVANAAVLILISILTIMRVFKPQMYILSISNIVLALLSMLYIPKFGLLGAMILFALLNTMQMILLYAWYKMYIRKQKIASR